MRKLMRVLCCAVVPLILTGCVTQVRYVYHPSVYTESGRPDWTYDENRIKEDLTGDKPEYLCEELKNPDAYYFFLGTQSETAETEEDARKMALEDAGREFDEFLRTRGTQALEENLKQRLDELQITDFETKIHMIAITEIKHLKPVRWCIEEKRVSDWRWQYMFSRARWYKPGWKAWCVTAFPRERCENIYRILVEQAEVENLENFSKTKSQTEEMRALKPGM